MVLEDNHNIKGIRYCFDVIVAYLLFYFVQLLLIFVLPDPKIITYSFFGGIVVLALIQIPFVIFYYGHINLNNDLTEDQKKEYKNYIYIFGIWVVIHYCKKYITYQKHNINPRRVIKLMSLPLIFLSMYTIFYHIILFRGNRLLDEKNFGEASKLYSAGLIFYRNNNKLLNYLGFTYYFNKEYSKAIEVGEIFAEKHPEDNLSYYLIALSYSAIGKDEEAIENFDHSIRINPKHSYSYHFKANILFESDRLKAIELYKKAAILGNEKSKEILRNKGIEWNE